MGGKLKFGLLILPLAGLTWVVVAIVLGTGSFSGAHASVGPSGPSPSCLPATLEHNATLPGTNVSVSPAPETDTANPYTQISFLGIPVADIQNVSVVGSRSGYHYGHVYGYFQGDGGSFVPNERLQRRRACRRARGPRRTRLGQARSASASASTPPIRPLRSPSFPNPPAPASSIQSFVSAPEVHPPVLSVTVPDRDPAAGDILITVGPGPGQYGPLIYTPAGRVVWFDPLSGGLAAEDLNMQSYEGQRDLTWWQGHVLALGFGQGEDLVMNSNYQVLATDQGRQWPAGRLARLPAGSRSRSHTSAPTTSSAATSPRWAGPRNGVHRRYRRAGDRRQDRARALGMAQPRPRRRQRVPRRRAAHRKPTPWDWFHLNSIDPEPDGNLLDLRTLHLGGLPAAAGQRSGSSGGWAARGAASPWATAPPTAWQHDGRMLPDGEDHLLRRRLQPAHPLPVARRAREARPRHAHGHFGARLHASRRPPRRLPGQHADARRRNVVVGWGAVPAISEFAKEGSLLFDAHLPPGMSLYRAFRFPWHGASAHNAGREREDSRTNDSTAVFASWNGASNIASWRVLAGSDASSLKPQATMPRQRLRELLPRCPKR